MYIALISSHGAYSLYIHLFVIRKFISKYVLSGNNDDFRDIYEIIACDKHFDFLSDNMHSPWGVQYLAWDFL